jgi:hypothetical protein
MVLILSISATGLGLTRSRLKLNVADDFPGEIQVSV